MNAHDVLLEAAKLVRKGWCQGALARDQGGRICDYAADVAVCWCAAGAIHRAAILATAKQESATASDYGKLDGAACDVMVSLVGRRFTYDWNDAPGRTAEEVALKLEEAAQLALKGKA